MAGSNRSSARSSIGSWSRLVLCACLLAMSTASGCVGPKGETDEEKIAYAHQVRDEALQVFYERHPGLEEDVKSASGYMVFSNFSIHPGMFSYASGYGVLTNNQTQHETHSKWFRLTLGPGIAVKGAYVLVVVNDPELMKKLEDGKWLLFGGAEAALRFGDFGGNLDWVSSAARWTPTTSPTPACRSSWTSSDSEGCTATPTSIPRPPPDPDPRTV